MAKFIEVLREGLTVSGKVQPLGAAVQVHSGFDIMKTRDQVERWGAPRYKEITKADFEARGGKEVPAQEPDPFLAAAKEEAVEETQVVPADKFEALVGLNAEETLAAVAQMSEEDQAEFIVFEAAGPARKSVLGPLGVAAE